MHLNYALRTVTGWVRSWRGDGSLPPQGQRPDLP
jgi:transposase